MRKVISIASKEIRLVKSQRMAMVLIVIYPLLIVFAIAAAFSGSPEIGNLFGKAGLEQVGVALYLPDSTGFFDAPYFLEKLGETQNLKIYKADSPENVKNAIENRVARVGLVVIPPKDVNDKINIDLYYDNSALLAARTISAYAGGAINRISGDKSKEILEKIWLDLSKIKDNLASQKKKTDSFTKGLDDAEQRLYALKEKINGIDIATMKSQLETFDFYYSDTKTQLADAKKEIIDSRLKLDQYKAKLMNARDELSTYSSELKSIKNTVILARQASPEPIKSQLIDIENRLNAEIVKIDSTIADIDSAIYDIGQGKIKLNEAEQSLSLADSRLDESKGAVEGFKETVQYLEETLAETNALLDDALEYQKQTKKELIATNDLLDSLIKTIDEFQNYQPAYLVKPIEINEKKMYEVNDLAILLPQAIAIVLLLTCLLMTSISVLLEREQGASFRAMLSPTSKAAWLSGKILGQLVFVVAEALLIFAVGFLLFSVPLAGGILALLGVLALVSVVFISMGIFLTNFTKTQSTAILSSLLIMIPMLFLAGIIFPIEFMPSGIAAFAEALPLTAAANLITTVIVKGTPLTMAWEGIAVLAVYGIVFLLFSIFKKEV
ncbi:MAG: ABC transporter permease [Candidatus Diapherotrites archaeon]